MNIKSTRTGLSILLILLAACTTQPSPDRQSETAPDADFSSYSTYGWQPLPADSADQPIRLLDARIRTAIRAEMSRRGYTEVDTDPDLRIAWETAADDRVRSSPFRIGIGLGSFGSNVGGSVNVGSPAVQSYREGSLVIHVVNAAENRELWFGSVAGSTDKTSQDADAVARNVALAMQDLPGRNQALPVN
jgi:hypothetical protein